MENLHIPYNRQSPSIPLYFSQCTVGKKLVKAKDVPHGDTTLGKLLISLLLAWLESKVTYFLIISTIRKTLAS
jgi:hypothetical protein